MRASKTKQQNSVAESKNRKNERNKMRYMHANVLNAISQCLPSSLYLFIYFCIYLYRSITVFKEIHTDRSNDVFQPDGYLC